MKGSMVRTVSTNVIATTMGHVSQKMGTVFVNQAGREEDVTNLVYLVHMEISVSKSARAPKVNLVTISTVIVSVLQDTLEWHVNSLVHPDLLVLNAEELVHVDKTSIVIT